MYKLGRQSYKRLIGVNPILSSLVVYAISKARFDFTVFEGIRTIERQRMLVDTGRSWTMRSNHITGNAVDLVPLIDGYPRWEGYNTKEVFEDIHRCMLEASAKYDVDITWGGDWKLVDKPHYQLNLEYRDGYDYLHIMEE